MCVCAYTHIHEYLQFVRLYKNKREIWVLPKIYLYILSARTLSHQGTVRHFHVSLLLAGLLSQKCHPSSSAPYLFISNILLLMTDKCTWMDWCKCALLRRDHAEYAFQGAQQNNLKCGEYHLLPVASVLSQTTIYETSIALM